MPEAFVTLATNVGYCMGSLVVGKCLRRYGTTRKLVVMVSPNISAATRLSLEDVFDEVVVVDVLDSRDRAHLLCLGRPDLGITFTKLHCWTLTQYSKCVFLDADTLVLGNVDELFEREELSAAPDAGWPDCFNSGVFVFVPSLATHTQLLEQAHLHGSFDGGDQGLLNSFFSDWAIKDISKHLPFIYNLSANMLYTYLPAFCKYGHQAKIVHFLGKTKPWHLGYNQQPTSGLPSWNSNRNLQRYVNLWWAEYYSQTQKLSEQPSEHPSELRDSAPIQHEDAGACLSAVPAPLQLQQGRSVSPLRMTPPPQSLEMDSKVQGEDAQTGSPSLGEGTLSESPASSCQQPQEVLSESEKVTASDSDDSDWFGDPGCRHWPGGWSHRNGARQGAQESEEESREHRRNWEEGRVDYLGKDAFENIRKKLDRFLN
ncbi:glycogenin-2 [Electrophorus electricus]|uniref:glycogenin-2 n=1 Tax=Electrophorus electricus TaxID=8005 RepID=UPI0015CFFB5C|nr:glycogenin-2 [Electrophorus electricus]